MQKQWHLMMWMMILTIALVGFAGCSDDDDDNNTVAPTIKPYVYGMAFQSGGGPRKAAGDPGYAYVSVANAPVVPGVTINGDALNLEPEMTIYGGSLGYYGEFVYGAGNTAALVVNLDGETGGASVAVPDTFSVVGDDDVYLNYFSSHTFEWTDSDGAERYWVWADFEANYVDNEGNTQYFNNEFAFTTTGNSVTFAASDMFPPEADVDHFTYFWGDLDVTSVNGPMEPGDGTNITGAATGYLIGIGDSIDWNIEENVPMKQVQDREQEADWLNRYVEIMH